jgi:hypothetical protein
MFWHTLALRLGMTVREAQKTITRDEFVSWIAYNKINPISDVRGDLQMARICSVIAATAGSKRSMKDFMFDFNKKEQSISGNHVVNFLKKFGGDWSKCQTRVV